VVKVVLLDSAPLGLLTDPKSTRAAVACRAWAHGLKAAGHRVVVPEIIDYELRRELIRAGKVVGVAALNAVAVQFEYLSLDTRTMLRAADLWAQARQTGRPTAGNKNIDIDIDMILVAQAETLQLPDTVIATDNLRHLRHFFSAELWTNILP